MLWVRFFQVMYESCMGSTEVLLLWLYGTLVLLLVNVEGKQGGRTMILNVLQDRHTCGLN